MFLYNYILQALAYCSVLKLISARETIAGAVRNVPPTSANQSSLHYDISHWRYRNPVNKRFWNAHLFPVPGWSWSLNHKETGSPERVLLKRRKRRSFNNKVKRDVNDDSTIGNDESTTSVLDLGQSEHTRQIPVLASEPLNMVTTPVFIPNSNILPHSSLGQNLRNTHSSSEDAAATVYTELAEGDVNTRSHINSQISAMTAGIVGSDVPTLARTAMTTGIIVSDVSTLAPMTTGIFVSEVSTLAPNAMTTGIIVSDVSTLAPNAVTSLDDVASAFIAPIAEGINLTSNIITSDMSTIPPAINGLENLYLSTAEFNSENRSLIENVILSSDTDSIANTAIPEQSTATSTEQSTAIPEQSTAIPEQSTATSTEQSTAIPEQSTAIPEQSTATSTEQTPSTSTEQTHSTSTEQTPSTSTEQTHSTSTEQTPSTSTEQTHSTSTEQTPSTSTEQTHSTSTEQTHSTSTEQTHSTSTEQTHSTSTEQNTSGSTAATQDHTFISTEIYRSVSSFVAHVSENVEPTPLVSNLLYSVPTTLSREKFFSERTAPYILNADVHSTVTPIEISSLELRTLSNELRTLPNELRTLPNDIAETALTNNAELLLGSLQTSSITNDMALEYTSRSPASEGSITDSILTQDLHSTRKTTSVINESSLTLASPVAVSDATSQSLNLISPIREEISATYIATVEHPPFTPVDSKSSATYEFTTRALLGPESQSSLSSDFVNLDQTIVSSSITISAQPSSTYDVVDSIESSSIVPGEVTLLNPTPSVATISIDNITVKSLFVNSPIEYTDLSTVAAGLDKLTILTQMDIMRSVEHTTMIPENVSMDDYNSVFPSESSIAEITVMGTNVLSLVQHTNLALDVTSSAVRTTIAQAATSSLQHDFVHDLTSPIYPTSLVLGLTSSLHDANISQDKASSVQIIGMEQYVTSSAQHTGTGQYVTSSAQQSGTGQYVTSSAQHRGTGQYVNSPAQLTGTGHYATSSLQRMGLDQYVTSSVQHTGIRPYLSSSVQQSDMDQYVTSSVQPLGMDQYVSNSKQHTGIRQYVNSSVQQSGMDQYVTSSVQPLGMDQYVTSSVQQSGMDQYVTSSVQQSGMDQYVTSSVQQSGKDQYVNSSVQQSGMDQYVSSSLQVPIQTESINMENVTSRPERQILVRLHGVSPVYTSMVPVQTMYTNTWTEAPSSDWSTQEAFTISSSIQSRGDRVTDSGDSNVLFSITYNAEIQSAFENISLIDLSRTYIAPLPSTLDSQDVLDTSKQYDTSSPLHSGESLLNSPTYVGTPTPGLEHLISRSSLIYDISSGLSLQDILTTSPTRISVESLSTTSSIDQTKEMSTYGLLPSSSRLPSQSLHDPTQSTLIPDTGVFSNLDMGSLGGTYESDVPMELTTRFVNLSLTTDVSSASKPSQIVWTTLLSKSKEPTASLSSGIWHSLRPTKTISTFSTSVLPPGNDTNNSASSSLALSSTHVISKISPSSTRRESPPSPSLAPTHIVVTSAPSLKNVTIQFFYDGNCELVNTSPFKEELVIKLYKFFYELVKINAKSINIGNPQCNPQQIIISFRDVGKSALMTWLRESGVTPFTLGSAQNRIWFNVTDFREMVQREEKPSNVGDIVVIIVALCICVTLVTAGIIVFVKEIYMKRGRRDINALTETPVVAKNSLVEGKNDKYITTEMTEERSADESYCSPYDAEYSSIGNGEFTSFTTSVSCGSAPANQENGRPSPSAAQPKPKLQLRKPRRKSNSRKNTGKYGLVVGLMGCKKTQVRPHADDSHMYAVHEKHDLPTQHDYPEDNCYVNYSNPFRGTGIEQLVVNGSNQQLISTKQDRNVYNNSVYNAAFRSEQDPVTSSSFDSVHF